jgi:hypothetical protein
MQPLVRATTVAGLVMAGACTAGTIPAGPTRMDRQVGIRGHELTLHLAEGVSPATGPLLLYATGDGGYPGDEGLFERMMPWGLPMAAFSSADYISFIDGPGRVIAPDLLATDLQTVIGAAQSALGLPSGTRVVFVGFSRGAGLAVSAATSPAFRGRLRGILAIGLTAEEDYVSERVNGEDRMLQTYGALPRLGDLRVAVIQSTNDSFVPADDARRRFGPDTPTRRLRPIAARDHSFAGGLDELALEMKASLDWIMK